ncbi:MAG: DUF4160 domain-containing protein [Caldilineaceae bacterium]
MPVAHREKGYRFYFIMFDLNEPMHIHVDKGGKTAKFWLSPIKLARNQGYRQHELSEIESMIDDNIQKLITVWMTERARRS